jgi:acetyl-CoA C-acetyltransferase
MATAVIVDAVRTPFGKRGGKFRDTHPQDLAAAPLKALERRVGFDPSIVDDVLLGCGTPTEDQGFNIGRIAPLVAGWDVTVPGVQLNRMCGSGQEAVVTAAAKVTAGQGDVYVAGGVEHMTRVEMGSDEAEMTPTYFEHIDEFVSQGESAERIAQRWDLSRSQVDRLAAASQHRWGEAWEDGRYDSQVVPVETTLDGEPVSVERDGHPRPDTSFEDLADLPLVFRDEEDGVIHAGNSSGIVDGASATLVTSEATAREHGWEPLAYVRETATTGVDPIVGLTGPIPATEQLLNRAPVTLSDIDLFEVNEAFASVVLAWLEETGAAWERTNVNGGAIAHGHPIGATGASLMTKLVHAMHERTVDQGVSAMCIGFGQGIATRLERY